MSSTENTLVQEIKASIRYSLSKNSDKAQIFSSLLDKFEAYYAKPCHNVLELKRRSTKTKGDLWENFCVLYLKAQAKWKSVWLLNDISVAIANKLSIAGQDMGIDIVVE